MKRTVIPLLPILLFPLCTEEEHKYPVFANKISMVMTPAEDFYELQTWEKTYALARDNGVSISNIHLEWGEIELSKGKYNWEGPDFYNMLAEEYDMELSVEIKIIGTNH